MVHVKFQDCLGVFSFSDGEVEVGPLCFLVLSRLAFVKMLHSKRLKQYVRPFQAVGLFEIHNLQKNGSKTVTVMSPVFQIFASIS